MRFLHTSDWHIGRKFNKVDLHADQAEFFDWLVAVVDSEDIECVLIAGDVFDRANPSPESVELADDIFARLIASGTQVVAISGNHDSAERMNFGSAAMAAAGLHIRTERKDLAMVGSPITITSKRNGDSTQVLPIPYLEPQRIIQLSGAVRSHEGVVHAVVQKHIATLSQPHASIAMAHAWVAGGSASDSERQLTVGGTATVSPSIFDGLGYVALGHLHRPQHVSTDRIHYSGSPLSYSFSEEHQKLVRIIDTQNNMSSTALPIDVGRPVRTITDSFENLLNVSTYDDVKNCFVRACLTDTALQLGAMDALRQRFPYILDINYQSLTPQGKATIYTDQQRTRTTPGDTITEYLSETFGDDIDETTRQFVLDVVDSVVAGGSE